MCVCACVCAVCVVCVCGVCCVLCECLWVTETALSAVAPCACAYLFDAAEIGTVLASGRHGRSQYICVFVCECVNVCKCVSKGHANLSIIMLEGEVNLFLTLL